MASRLFSFQVGVVSGDGVGSMAAAAGIMHFVSQRHFIELNVRLNVSRETEVAVVVFDTDTDQTFKRVKAWPRNMILVATNQSEMQGGRRPEFTSKSANSKSTATLQRAEAFARNERCVFIDATLFGERLVDRILQMTARILYMMAMKMKVREMEPVRIQGLGDSRHLLVDDAFECIIALPDSREAEVSDCKLLPACFGFMKVFLEFKDGTVVQRPRSKFMKWTKRILLCTCYHIAHDSETLYENYGAKLRLGIETSLFDRTNQVILLHELTRRLPASLVCNILQRLPVCQAWAVSHHSKELLSTLAKSPVLYGKRLLVVSGLLMIPGPTKRSTKREKSVTFFIDETGQRTRCVLRPGAASWRMEGITRNGLLLFQHYGLDDARPGNDLISYQQFKLTTWKGETRCLPPPFGIRSLNTEGNENPQRQALLFDHSYGDEHQKHRIKPVLVIADNKEHLVFARLGYCCMLNLDIQGAEWKFRPLPDFTDRYDFVHVCPGGTVYFLAIDNEEVTLQSIIVSRTDAYAMPTLHHPKPEAVVSVFGLNDDGLLMSVLEGADEDENCYVQLHTLVRSSWVPKYPRTRLRRAQKFLEWIRASPDKVRVWEQERLLVYEFVKRIFGVQLDTGLVVAFHSRISYPEVFLASGKGFGLRQPHPAAAPPPPPAGHLFQMPPHMMQGSPHHPATPGSPTMPTIPEQVPGPAQMIVAVEEQVQEQVEEEMVVQEEVELTTTTMTTESGGEAGDEEQQASSEVEEQQDDGGGDDANHEEGEALSETNSEAGDVEPMVTGEQQQLLASTG